MPNYTKGRPKKAGRTKGTPNKSTLEKLALIARDIGGIKRQGDALAREMLNDLMKRAFTLTLAHEPKVEGGKVEFKDPEDEAKYIAGLTLTGVFAKELAPYQSPKLSAVKVQEWPMPTDPMKTIEGSKLPAVNLDDEVEVARYYVRTMKQISAAPKTGG
jgi:hypothetical protein